MKVSTGVTKDITCHYRRKDYHYHIGRGEKVNRNMALKLPSYVHVKTKCDLHSYNDDTCNHSYQRALFTENAESAELLLKVSPCLEASSPLEDVKQCNTSLYLSTVSLHTLSLEGTNVRFKCSLQLVLTCHGISLLVVLALLV